MKRECSPVHSPPQTPGLAGGFALGPALASHDKARQVASGLGWGGVGGGAQKTPARAGAVLQKKRNNYQSLGTTPDQEPTC
jgi:hypothetical protein